MSAFWLKQDNSLYDISDQELVKQCVRRDSARWGRVGLVIQEHFLYASADSSARKYLDMWI